MNDLAASFAENLIFVLEFLGLVAAMVIIAYVVEKMGTKEKRKQGTYPHHQKNSHDRRIFGDSGHPAHAGFPHPLCPGIL